MSTDQKIYNQARARGIPSPLALFIVAQARHETGNYTHRFFTQGNNAFGYSYVPGATWQLATPGPPADNGIPIAQYATLADSVNELVDWIGRRQREGRFPSNLASITTPEQYARLLKQTGYYGAPESLYAAALARHYQSLTTLNLGSAGPGALFSLAAVVVLVMLLAEPGQA